MSIDCWDERAGGHAVIEIGHYVNPDGEFTDEMHVFKLDTGKHVVVYESGCSCYEYADADIDVLPVDLAMKKYQEYKQKHGGVFSNLERLEMLSRDKEEKANEPRCKNCNS